MTSLIVYTSTTDFFQLPLPVEWKIQVEDEDQIIYDVNGDKYDMISFIYASRLGGNLPVKYSPGQKKKKSPVTNKENFYFTRWEIYSYVSNISSRGEIPPQESLEQKNQEETSEETPVWRLVPCKNNTPATIEKMLVAQPSNKSRIGSGRYGVINAYHDYNIVTKRYVEEEDFLSTDFVKEIGIYRYMGQFFPDDNVLLGYDAFQRKTFLQVYDTDISEYDNDIILDYDNEKWCALFYQLGTKLARYNATGWYHGDFKPDNIVIRDHRNAQFENFSDWIKTNCAIIDWGLSLRGYSNKGCLVQSLFWRAPEIALADDLAEKDRMDYTKCDIWSFGVVLYEMLTNSYLFEIKGEKESNDKENRLLQIRMRSVLGLKFPVKDMILGTEKSKMPKKSKKQVKAPPGLFVPQKGLLVPQKATDTVADNSSDTIYAPSNTPAENLVWIKASKKGAKLSPEAQELIANILCIDPKLRWNWNQILSSAYFTKYAQTSSSVARSPSNNGSLLLNDENRMMRAIESINKYFGVSDGREKRKQVFHWLWELFPRSSYDPCFNTFFLALRLFDDLMPLLTSMQFTSVGEGLNGYKNIQYTPTNYPLRYYLLAMYILAVHLLQEECLSVDVFFNKKLKTTLSLWKQQHMQIINRAVHVLPQLWQPTICDSPQYANKLYSAHEKENINIFREIFSKMV